MMRGIAIKKKMRNGTAKQREIWNTMVTSIPYVGYLGSYSVEGYLGVIRYTFFKMTYNSKIE